MTIAEFAERRIRSSVGYVGEAPDVSFTRIVELLGYRVVALTSEALAKPALLADIDSVIFSQRADKPVRVHHELEEFGATLLNHDCRIYVRVTADPGIAARAQPIVLNALNTLQLPAGPLNLDDEAQAGQDRGRSPLPFAPFVFVCYSGLSWEALAKLVADNPSGDPPNTDVSIDAVTADHQVLALDDDEALLIRRAFRDCSEVHLRQMPDGLSGVRAFRAYAVPAEGLLGPWPMIRFVKIGVRGKIVREYKNYQGNALVYVPAHLAPRLDRVRCCLGASKGILVGDFVDEAEPLRDCARGGRASAAIANLFNKTLRSWQRRGTLDETHPLGELLSERLDKPIPEHRLKRIKELGASGNLEEIRRRVKAVTSQPVKVGVTHGDLHATNVLVRGTDAILIDFERLCANAPLLCDLASLEGGLLVEAFAGDRRSAHEWLESVIDLYRSPILREPSKDNPRDPSAWFYGCVRQIRLHARELECEGGQYEVALAVALIAKGCNPNRFNDECEAYRAAAYLLGERILTSAEVAL